MEGTGGDHAKQNESEGEIQTLDDLTYILDINKKSKRTDRASKIKPLDSDCRTEVPTEFYRVQGSSRHW